MDDDLKISNQGTPRWFSPKHAGEKFKEICIVLAQLALDAEKAKKKSLSEKLWELQATAEGYAKHYYCRSPVQSIRIMEPSGAIYAILADGREVTIPQE